MMQQFVVWKLHGVKMLGFSDGTPWLQTLKRLPNGI